MLQLYSSIELLFLTCLPVWHSQIIQTPLDCKQAQYLPFQKSRWQRDQLHKHSPLWRPTGRHPDITDIDTHKHAYCLSNINLICVNCWAFFFGIHNFLCRPQIKEPIIVTKICELCLSFFFFFFLKPTQVGHIRRLTSPKFIHKSNNVEQ